MFSIVMPIDLDRFPQFTKTLNKYIEQGLPEGTEFLFPTRNPEMIKSFLEAHGFNINYRILSYSYDNSKNPSMALNLAVKEAKHEHIIITCPEVIPTSKVLEQFLGCLGKNVVAQVFDETDSGSTYSLINNNPGFRNGNPGLYFLALFNKKDIYAINGFDEEFMKTYAFEDTDFGYRWVRARLPFEVRDDITALHQWHKRGEMDSRFYGGEAHFHDNNNRGVIKCKNGLIKLEEDVCFENL